MDYHSMKRKELQALCKKHNIPANSTNSELANKLSELFNEKQKPTRQRTCLKSSDETFEETDSGVARRQAKKVRFSPNNEVVEYELRSGRKGKSTATETMPRRKSAGKKVDKLAVDNAINVIESVIESGEVPARVTRSRVQKLGKDDVIPVNEKKRGRRTVKDVENENGAFKESEVTPLRVTRLKGQKVGKEVVILDEKKQHKRMVNGIEKESEAVNENEVHRIRVTRSKMQTLVEDGVALDLNPHIKKKSGGGVVKDVVMVEPSKSVRVTRSREQTIQDDKGNTVADSQAEKKRARTTQNTADRSSKSTVMSTTAATEDKQEFSQRKSLRNRELEIDDEDVREQKHGERKKRSKNSINEVSGNEKEADKGLRRSRRNEANVEGSTVLNKNVSEVENKKITRSRAQLAPYSVEGNSKSKPETGAKGRRESKMVHQPNDPLEHAGRRNVNRGKSAMSKPDNSEMVLQLEEPVNRPARKDTRRKSVMHRAEEKGFDKSAAGKEEMVRENEMVQLNNVPSMRSRRQTVLQPIAPTGDHVGTRITSGRKQSKEQSGNLSSIEEGASRNEMNEAAHSTGNRRTRKRRGESVNEEKASESEYASPIHGTPRKVTLSAGKTEGKAVENLPQNSVAKTQQQSNSKTPTITMHDESAAENASLRGKQSARALRSAGVIGDNSSNKRARLSTSSHGTNQSTSEKGRAVEFNKEEASASEFGSIEINERITETLAFKETARRVTRSAIKSERNVSETPRRVTRSVIKSERNVNETPRRGTRSVIKSERNAVGNLSEKVDKKKQPSVSALKGQFIEDAQLSSPEVAEVGPDSAIDETPRQFTRSAIENERNAVDDLFQEVDNEKQSSFSALSGSPVEDSLLSSPGLAEVRPITDDTKEVHSENVKEVEGRISVNSGDLSASASMRSQNQEVCVQSAVLNETEVKIAIDSVETSILKSVGIKTYEKEDMEMTTTGSRSARLETEDGDEEQEVCAQETVAIEEMVDMSLGVIAKANADSASNFDAVLYEFGSSADCHMSRQPSNIKTNLKEMEIQPDPSTTGGVSDSPNVYEHHFTDDGVDAQIEMNSKQELLTCKDILQSPSVGEHEIANNDEHDFEDKKINAELVIKPDVEDNRVHNDIGILQNPGIGNHDVADEGVGGQEMNSQREPSTNKNACQSLLVDEHLVEYNRVDIHELVSQLDPSSNDEMLHGLSVGGNHIEDDIITTQEIEAEKDKESTGKSVLSSPAMEGRNVANDEVLAEKELNFEQELPTNKDQLLSNVLEIPVLVKDDVEVDGVDATKEFKPELKPSTADNMLEIPVLSSGDAEDEGANANKELESVPEPSTSTYLFDTPVLGKDDVEDDNVEATNEFKSGSEPSTSDEIPEIHVLVCDDADDQSVNANKEVESEPEPSIVNYLFDTSLLGKADGVDPTKALELDSDIPEIHILGRNDDEDEGLNANEELEPDTYVLGEDDVDLTKELEPDSGPSTADNIPEVPVLGRDAVEDEGVDANEELEFEPELDTSVLGKDDGLDITKEVNSVSEPSIADNILAVPVLHKVNVEDDVDASEEFESASNQSTANKIVKTPVLSSGHVENEGINANKEIKSDSVPSTAGNRHEIPVLGKDDVEDEGANAYKVHTPVLGRDDIDEDAESDSEPSNTGIPDIPVMGSDDVEDDGVNDTKDFESDSKPLTVDNILETHVLSSGNVEDEVMNANKELEDGGVDAMELESELEPSSTTDNVVEIPVLGSEDVKDDGVNANKDQKSVGEEAVLSEESPTCSLNSEKGNSSFKQTDNGKDADVSVGVLGGGSPPHVENSKDPAENFAGEYGQHSFCPMAQIPESEYQGFSMDTELRKVKAENATENDHVLADKMEQSLATVNHDLGGDTWMAEVPVEHDHVAGTLGTHESAIREESLPITLKNEDSFATLSDTVSDPLPSLKDDDKDNQAGVNTPFDIRIQSVVRTFTEETQKTRTSEDPGKYSIDMDEYQRPVQAHKSDDDDALGDGMRDSRVSDLLDTSSARASSPVEGSSSPSTEFFSETKMEKASINVADEKSIQDVDITTVNSNITIKSLDVSEEFFNWSEDPCLREFFASPATTSIRHVKDNQEHTVHLDFSDKCEDVGRNEGPVHDLHHVWDNESSRVSEFSEEAKHKAPGSPDIGMTAVVPDFDDFSHQYLDEKVDGGKNDNLIFEDDQFDRINEPQTSYHKASGSTEPQDNIRMEDDKFEGTRLEQDLPESNSEIGDDFASDKVIWEKVDVKVAESQSHSVGSYETTTVTGATPHKLIMTSDMKENAKSLKGEHTARSTIRRHALENIIPKK